MFLVRELRVITQTTEYGLINVGGHRPPTKEGEWPLLYYSGPGHLLTIAPTRTGNGIGSIVPNLPASAALLARCSSSIRSRFQARRVPPSIRSLLRRIGQVLVVRGLGKAKQFRLDRALPRPIGLVGLPRRLDGPFRLISFPSPLDRRRDNRIDRRPFTCCGSIWRALLVHLEPATV
jgi:hypothetical protein